MALVMLTLLALALPRIVLLSPQIKLLRKLVN